MQCHIRVLEATQENITALLAGLEYLIDISYVDDTEVFKVWFLLCVFVRCLAAIENFTWKTITDISVLVYSLLLITVMIRRILNVVIDHQCCCTGRCAWIIGTPWYQSSSRHIITCIIL